MSALPTAARNGSRGSTCSPVVVRPPPLLAAALTDPPPPPPQVTKRLGRARGFRLWHLNTLQSKLYYKHVSLVRVYWSRLRLHDAWRAWCR